MEKDSFAWNTASQDAKFPDVDFANSDSDQSSLPNPTPAEPSEIVMVSLSGSQDSVEQHAEDESVFHPCSSQDQNDAVDRRRNKVRAFEAVEPEAKKFRAMDENVDEFVEEDIVNLGEEKRRIEDIDGFRYTGASDTRPQMPASFKGKEKEKEAETKKKGLMDYLDVLKDIFDDGSKKDDDDDEDFFEMLKKTGYTFPKPRWRP